MPIAIYLYIYYTYMYYTIYAGILLDDDLRWNLYVDYLTKKGAGLLLDSFSNLKRFGTPTEVFKSVYCSNVRPSLEYACPAWHPGLIKDQTDRLETIQKRAVKLFLDKTTQLTRMH